MLLVDDDQARGRPAARTPPSAARRRPAPRRGAGAATRRGARPAEPGVQHRDDVAEARLEALDSVCGVRAISGTSTIAARPGASAASAARR